MPICIFPMITKDNVPFEKPYTLQDKLKYVMEYVLL